MKIIEITNKSEPIFREKSSLYEIIYTVILSCGCETEVIRLYADLDNIRGNEEEDIRIVPVETDCPNCNKKI